jgi:hypothetical protein
LPVGRDMTDRVGPRFERSFPQMDKDPAAGFAEILSW